jgi:hypothetical protein
MDFLLLKCLKPGCPRTRRVSREICRDVPATAVEIRSFCPWHCREGDKAYPEVYFDAAGREVESQTKTSSF